MKPVAFASLVIVSAACVIRTGTQPGTFEPAHAPNGIAASLSVTSMRIVGELLEVRDTGLVVLAQERVVLVPFPTIRLGTFRHTKVTIVDGRPPAGDALAELRMLSRFPYGIPRGALRRLLVSKRQDSLAVIQP
jgi:hypothetical protein